MKEELKLVLHDGPPMLFRMPEMEKSRHTSKVKPPSRPDEPGSFFKEYLKKSLPNYTRLYHGMSGS